jgi:hypothetical protein
MLRISRVSVVWPDEPVSAAGPFWAATSAAPTAPVIELVREPGFLGRASQRERHSAVGALAQPFLRYPEVWSRIAADWVPIVENWSRSHREVFSAFSLSNCAGSHPAQRL